MSDDIEMPTICPQCNKATEPADFHFLPDGEGGLKTTYECLGCNEEKPTEEWVALHKARFDKALEYLNEYLN